MRTGSASVEGQGADSQVDEEAAAGDGGSKGRVRLIVPETGCAAVPNIRGRASPPPPPPLLLLLLLLLP